MCKLGKSQDLNAVTSILPHGPLGKHLLNNRCKSTQSIRITGQNLEEDKQKPITGSRRHLNRVSQGVIAS